MDLVVVAKAPVAGRVKTRLCPPCTLKQAAALAEAALADTLEAAVASSADRVIFALDGAPGVWLPAGITLVPQGDGPLSSRLATAWSHVRGAGVQVGMDTPQVTSGLLDAALETVAVPDVDAAIGFADDGGWWAIGMQPPDPTVFATVPTSRPDTGRRQHARLVALGRRTALLPPLRDVDTYDDARAVAAAAPDTRFAAAFTALAGVGVDAVRV